MSKANVLSVCVTAYAKHSSDKRLKEYGRKMFDMYTAGGFPPDMFISELRKRVELSLLEVVFIVSHYQTLFLEHRRKSGVHEKRIEAIRRRNREDMQRLIETGELGVY